MGGGELALRPQFWNALSSRGANMKLQKLFTFVKLAEKNGGVPTYPFQLSVKFSRSSEWSSTIFLRL